MSELITLMVKSVMEDPAVMGLFPPKQEVDIMPLGKTILAAADKLEITNDDIRVYVSNLTDAQLMRVTVNRVCSLRDAIKEAIRVEVCGLVLKEFWGQWAELHCKVMEIKIPTPRSGKAKAMKYVYKSRL